MNPATALAIFSEQGPATQRSPNHITTATNAWELITRFMTETERAEFAAAWALVPVMGRDPFNALLTTFRARLEAEGVL